MSSLAKENERLRETLAMALRWGLNGTRGYDAQIARQTKARAIQLLQMDVAAEILNGDGPKEDGDAGLNAFSRYVG